MHLANILTLVSHLKNQPDYCYDCQVFVKSTTYDDARIHEEIFIINFKASVNNSQTEKSLPKAGENGFRQVRHFAYSAELAMQKTDEYDCGTHTSNFLSGLQPIL